MERFGSRAVNQPPFPAQFGHGIKRFRRRIGAYPKVVLQHQPCEDRPSGLDELLNQQQAEMPVLQITKET